MKKFLSETSKKILKEIESLIPDKPGCITIYAGTNDITNNINSLNSVRKIVKNHVKKSSSIRNLSFPVYYSRMLKTLKSARY